MKNLNVLDITRSYGAFLCFEEQEVIYETLATVVELSMRSICFSCFYKTDEPNWRCYAALEVVEVAVLSIKMKTAETKIILFN